MPTAPTPEHVDVAVIGAGVAGIGAACQLAIHHPQRSVAVLERRHAIGGTWDLFRYPGIRCDSDMYTFGYSFRPWPSDHVLTDGDSIREYLTDTAAAHGVDERIRFGHRVDRIDWSTDDARWTVRSTIEATGETTTLTANFLVVCTGYYSYDRAHQPDIPGLDDFAGEVVHPQFWPQDLAWQGKRVVIVGSGATAVTLVPAMADDADVTMLQRSPSYIARVPSVDRVSRAMRRVLPDDLVSDLTRFRNLCIQLGIWNLSHRYPDLVRRVLLWQAERQLGPDVDMRHFTPDYDPWDQRLCVVPDGDLFQVLREGRASIVTDHIDHVTETGIQLRSGDHLDADLIVTATGLEIEMFGGMKGAVDGVEVDPSDRLLHRSIMVGDVPNLAFCFGYVNVSWTRKADLVGAYVCRLLDRMDRLGMRQVTPRGGAGHVSDEPFVEMTSGYIRRAADRLPRQGDSAPWRVDQDVLRDWLVLRHLPLADPTLEFTNPRPNRGVSERLASVVPLAATTAATTMGRALATLRR